MVNFQEILKRTTPEFEKFNRAERKKFAIRSVFTMGSFFKYALLTHFDVVPFYSEIPYATLGVLAFLGFWFMGKTTFWKLTHDLENSNQ